MRKFFNNKWTRIFKISGICLLGLLLVIILLPELFPGFVSQKIKVWANKSLTGELNYRRARLSFIKHFPTLSLTLYDFSLKGSPPFQQNTLVAGDELAFGIGLASIFQGKLQISQLLVSDADINIEVDSLGHPNYNIYKASPDTAEASSDSTTLSLVVEKIAITDARLIYNDQSMPMLIKAQGLNYVGKGDFTKSVFDLQSKLNIDTFDFVYDHEPYLESKRVNADLLTKINTNSLSFLFEKNDLQINKLPVSFKGALKFLKDGYQVDLQVHSQPSALANVVSILPPQYLLWQSKTELKGEATVSSSFSGNYIASTNTYPDLDLSIQLKDGFINFQKAPDPLSDILFRFRVKLPGLDPNRLLIDVDTLSFNLSKDFIRAGFHSAGLNPVNIKSNINAALDLAKLKRSSGIEKVDMKGNVKMKFDAHGRFASQRKAGWVRSQVTELPVFNLNAAIRDGYVKLAAVPFALEKLQLNLDAACSATQRNLDGIKIDIQPLSFLLAGEPFSIQASLSDFENLNYKIKSKGTIDLAKWYAFFHHDGVGLKGRIETDLSLAGREQDMSARRYDLLENSGTFLMENISLSYADYPQPFVVEEGLLRFNQDKIRLENFKTSYGSNTLLVNGYAENIIPYLLQKGALKGVVSLVSDKLNLDDFQAPPTNDTVLTNAAITAKGVLILPQNLLFNVQANIKQVLFDELDIKNFYGALKFDEGAATLQNTGFSLVGTSVNMNAFYRNDSPQKAVFKFDIKADSFDVQKAYREVKLFRDLAASAEKTEGIISLNYHLEGRLENNMEPVYPSLKGKGELKLDKVKVKGLRLFSAVSKVTGKDSVNNPDLSKVVIKSSIANNIITIERTKMRVFGFRPRFEGQTSFDGRLNLKMRLGLPPFGIIGIPLTVTGTSANPRVKVRRGKAGDLLEETVDEEEGADEIK